MGDFKLISGYPGHDSDWYPPDIETPTYADPLDWYRHFYPEVIKYQKQIKAGNETQYKLFNLKGMYWINICHKPNLYTRKISEPPHEKCDLLFNQGQISLFILTDKLDFWKLTQFEFN